jgi:hypothetical protein
MGLTRKKENKYQVKWMNWIKNTAKNTMLLPYEVDLRHCLKVRLMQLLREEEIK